MLNIYPYTDVHELNLDWFLNEFKKVVTEVNTLDETVQQFTDFVTNYFDNLDLQTEVNKKLNQMAADGTLAALIQPMFDEFETDINAEVMSQNNRIGVLEARMTTFAQLAEGSTTGDAELMDIRDGENGVTYDSAGDAVRGQFSDFYDIFEGVNGDTSGFTYFDGYYDENGETRSGGSFKRCEQRIPLKTGDWIILFATGYLQEATMIGECIENSNDVTPLVVSLDSDAHVYSYQADHDMYVSFCYNNLHPVKIFLLSSPYEINKEVSKIGYTFKDTSTFSYVTGWYNYNGALRNTADGFKRTTDDILLKRGYTVDVRTEGYNDRVSIIASGHPGTANVEPLVVSIDSTERTYSYTATEDTYIILTVREANYDVKIYAKNEDLFEIDDWKADIAYNIATFKKYGAIGDSLSSGECVHNEGGTNVFTDFYNFSWPQFLARKTGNPAINFSKGGLTTRSWLTNTEYGLNKLLNPDNKCDCYFIALGVNDATNLGLAYLGSLADIDVLNPTASADSFYGNYAKIIGYVRQVQPKAVIFCLTIPNSRQNATYTSFNNAIVDIASTMQTHLITLTTADDLKTWDNRRYGHYNALGYNKWADLIAEHVNEYMDANANDFRQIEFIGTNYSWT